MLVVIELGVPYQYQEGQPHVISYATRGLSRAAQNFSAHKFEFLALKRAICDKFQDYLYEHKLTVMTDNNPRKARCNTSSMFVSIIIV